MRKSKRTITILYIHGTTLQNNTFITLSDSESSQGIRGIKRTQGRWQQLHCLAERLVDASTTTGAQGTRFQKLHRGTPERVSRAARRRDCCSMKQDLGHPKVIQDRPCSSR